MASIITPYLSKAWFNPNRRARKHARYESKRKRKHQPHLVTVYLRINDPHSFLLLQVLDHLRDRYPLEYEFRTVLRLQSDMYPAPELWHQNAYDDCQYLTELYRDTADLDLQFCQQPPVSTTQRDTELTAQLLHWELQPAYLENALRLFKAYWQGDEAAIKALTDPAITGHAECYQHHLRANENMLQSKGHYLSAILHYAGEWYWGLDRLQYLERHLNELDIGIKGQDRLVFNQAQQKFCQRMSRPQIDKASKITSPIEMFFSTRSPYSYLGLLRARQLAEYYRIPLIVKPVLPMVMRRMQVPRSKTYYIMHDVSREAQQYGIPFGFVADPLGKGVENCYALYDFAQSQGKGIEFLESVARGVWAEGIHAETHKGLAKLVTRAGLNWQQAKTHLDDESWRIWAQNNLAELYANEQWGVPSFKFQDTTVFGQDRLDRIELAIAQALKGG